MAEDIIKKPPVFTDEVATIAKDIDIFAGWLKRLENPDPVLRTEAAGRGLKLYDDVDRDPHAGSVLQQRILAVVGKEWEILAARSARKMGRPAATSQEQVVADFVSEVLENCNFDQARQEILKAILYGFYVAEVLWENRGTPSNGVPLFSDRVPRIIIKKIIGKHPRRFLFTPERELRLLTLSNMIEGEILPERKFIVFTYGDSDNPYGRGLGQRLWWPVWFKKNGVKFWLVFLEKFGMPTVKGKYPPGATPDQKKALREAIEAIQSDTGLIFPDSMDVEFLEASRAGTVTHEQLCDYMDRQISKAVLGQTASTEGTPGKLGNEKAQEDVRQEIIEADADLLDGCLNETLIRWIVDYNFPGLTVYPKIKTYAQPKPDLKQQSEIDKTLAVDIGVPMATSYFYDTYGIPEPAEGEDLVNPPKPPTIGGQDSIIPPNSPGKQFTEPAVIRDAADAIADRLAAQAMKSTDEFFMMPMRRLVEKAGTLDELRDSILDLYHDLDPADLGVIIAQAINLAEMSGRYDVAEETGIIGKKKALNSPRGDMYRKPR
jgi:phage gp29-like protein